ncbi:hypothetical protein [Pleionea sp. CnH1-48]|uniref:hypothetical protein n=1 Tax=Pleionea sp. CnH1-48 TaxID=2954494 RepID=UPI002097E051|nr:hypothetical protein [Pleionea sp. CnH1-48]MCO7223443.1 hypothetical protein [Pleionea sp. CnH1-48]
MYEVLYDYASRPRDEYWFVIIGIPVSFLIVMRLRKNLKQDFSFKRALYYFTLFFLVMQCFATLVYGYQEWAFRQIQKEKKYHTIEGPLSELSYHSGYVNNLVNGNRLSFKVGDHQFALEEIRTDSCLKESGIKALVAAGESVVIRVSYAEEVFGNRNPCILRIEKVKTSN